MTPFPLETLKPHQDLLNKHSVYSTVQTTEDLRVFMEHHVFSVWDFMSIVKTLQSELAPTCVPWTPVGDPVIRRFINEIVLEEESDQGIPGVDQSPEFISHFELYIHAMEEIGASAETIKNFVNKASEAGIETALDLDIAPNAAQTFTRTTFDFIDSGKPHVIAAAFAFGREHIIPAMFRSLLDKMKISESAAPAFYYYLKRHIHLDEDFHAPLSVRMVEYFIQDDPAKHKEAVDAAISAINARIQFWDSVTKILPSTVTFVS